MSLFQTQRYVQTAADLIPSRTAARRGSVTVNNETAMRHSAVWACLRLRANLVSTMPVKVYRDVFGIATEIPAPKVLVTPGGERVGIGEWLYSTQFDLDRAGNCFGLITETDRRDFPARIDLLALGDVSVIVKDGEVTGYRISGEVYPPEKVWHERQYTVAGLHVGLSPVAYSAWSIGEYLSIQDFALEWFGNMTMPMAHLRNVEMAIPDPVKAAEIKARYKTSVQAGDPFVSGKDWELNPLTMANHTSDWIEGKQYGVTDIARFFDCPADLIDAAVQSGNVTYANVTQRNLQMLIMHLEPAINRREDALTKLTPRPQFVKLNTDKLLRMDPATRAATFAVQIESRTRAPSEVRAIDDQPAFTEAQLAEFDRLFGSPNAKPALPAKQPPGGTL